jgi:putative SOS response-associated peptidase YedK
VLSDIHERMPVILDPRDYARWLDPGNTDAAELRSLLVPCPEVLLARRTVGLRVNSPRNDDAECAAPAPPQPRQGELW